MRGSGTAGRRLSPLAGLGIASLSQMSSVALAAPAQPAIQAARSAHAAHNGDTLRLFLAGPSTLLILLASLAVVALIASGVGGLERLAGLTTRAMRRLELGFVVPTLWGVCAGLLIFALAAVLFAIKLGPLGVVILIVAFCLMGLGAFVAASVYGRGIAVAMGSVELEDLASLRLGLWTFLLASAIPFVGWLVVLLACAGGLGAVFQCLFAKRE